MPAGGCSPHAIELFPYYDASGTLTGMAQGGCKSQGGSSVEQEQRAQEPLTKMVNLTPDGSFSELLGLD